MNSKQKGGLAVGSAINHFMNQGISVLFPLSDHNLYDLAIEDNGTIKRVQCKYTDNKEPNGGYNVDLRTFGGYRKKTYFVRYKKGDFDYLFVLCGNQKKYLIPSDKIISKSHLVIGLRSWNEYEC